jgi:LysM repeat protein
MREYVVQHGDTLLSIAEKMLGQASRWPEIANLNNIRNPNLIFIGQRLSLPDARSVVRVSTSHQNGRAPHIPANVALARGFLFE